MKMSDAVAATDELDVRDVPKPQKHPLIFSRFAALPASGSFVLVNNHDPKHLRQEFDRDHAGTYGWDYLESGPKTWRIRISKLTYADLPRILCDVRTSAEAPDADGGVLWRLEVAERDLDANLVHLQPATAVAPHVGPDLDVLVTVVDGTGELVTETETIVLKGGDLVWLPRRSSRSIRAGAAGLRYLTVHRRRPALSITTLN